MRDVSQLFSEYVRNLEDDDIMAILLTLSNEEQEEPQARLTTTAAPVTSQGRVFEPSTARVTMPRGSLVGRGRTDGRLLLDNVSRSMVEWIRSSNSAPQVALEVVLLSSPNTIEIGPVNFMLGDIGYNDENMTIPLVRDVLFKKPFQQVLFDPHRTPALYA